jgi:hypothetical protein
MDINMLLRAVWAELIELACTLFSCAKPVICCTQIKDKDVIRQKKVVRVRIFKN